MAIVRVLIYIYILYGLFFDSVSSLFHQESYHNVQVMMSVIRCHALTCFIFHNFLFFLGDYKVPFVDLFLKSSPERINCQYCGTAGNVVIPEILLRVINLALPYLWYVSNLLF